MDVLDTMLRSEQYLPHGLYWCNYKNNPISKKLEMLLRRDGAYLVEIDGFDEFMAELNEGINLNLPDTVSDPYKATTNRLNSFILSEKVNHRIIPKR